MATVWDKTHKRKHVIANCCGLSSIRVTVIEYGSYNTDNNAREAHTAIFISDEGIIRAGEK